MHVALGFDRGQRLNFLLCLACLSEIAIASSVIYMYAFKMLTESLQAGLSAPSAMSTLEYNIYFKASIEQRVNDSSADSVQDLGVELCHYSYLRRQAFPSFPAAS